MGWTGPNTETAKALAEMSLMFTGVGSRAQSPL